MNEFKKGDKVKIKREGKNLSTGEIANIMKNGTILVHTYGTRGITPFSSDGIGKHGFYIEVKS